MNLKTSGVFMPITVENITEAMELADAAVTTDCYNFHTIARLAIRALKECEGNADLMEYMRAEFDDESRDHWDGYALEMPDGLEFDISAADAQFAARCGYRVSPSDKRVYPIKDVLRIVHHKDE